VTEIVHGPECLATRASRFAREIRCGPVGSGTESLSAQTTGDVGALDVSAVCVSHDFGYDARRRDPVQVRAVPRFVERSATIWMDALRKLANRPAICRVTRWTACCTSTEDGGTRFRRAGMSKRLDSLISTLSSRSGGLQWSTRSRSQLYSRQACPVCTGRIQVRPACEPD
jgi:hypothetical protein